LVNGNPQTVHTAALSGKGSMKLSVSFAFLSHNFVVPCENNVDACEQSKNRWVRNQRFCSRDFFVRVAASNDSLGVHNVAVGNVVYQTVTDHNVSDNTYDDTADSDSEIEYPPEMAEDKSEEATPAKKKSSSKGGDKKGEKAEKADKPDNEKKTSGRKSSIAENNQKRKSVGKKSANPKIETSRPEGSPEKSEKGEKVEPEKEKPADDTTILQTKITELQDELEKKDLVISGFFARFF
jgi:hypothetical protein